MTTRVTASDHLLLSILVRYGAPELQAPCVDPCLMHPGGIELSGGLVGAVVYEQPAAILSSRESYSNVQPVGQYSAVGFTAARNTAAQSGAGTKSIWDM